MAKEQSRVVYVVGAGLSAGLNFPTINNLLPEIWPSLEAANLADDLAEVIRFHHPDFNSSIKDTFPDIETLLSEMRANEQLFGSSRPATGNFTSQELNVRRQSLLLEMVDWFHNLQKDALKSPPAWLAQLIQEMKEEKAQIISFNWDLVLDELLSGTGLTKSFYGLGAGKKGVRLLKPHGSLNWFEQRTGKHLRSAKKVTLVGKEKDAIYAFKQFRAPKSKKSPPRTYMPLVVQPVLNKEFDGSLFEKLWQNVVSVLSTATEVRFLGYSLAMADFHARFILRCGFHNQIHGELSNNGSRNAATGQAKVTIVDPDEEVGPRIEKMVGWSCTFHNQTIENWLETRSG